MRDAVEFRGLLAVIGLDEVGHVALGELVWLPAPTVSCFEESLTSTTSPTFSLKLEILTRRPFTLTWPWLMNWRAANMVATNFAPIHHVSSRPPTGRSGSHRNRPSCGSLRHRCRGNGVRNIGVITFKLLLGAQLHARSRESLPLRRWPCWPGRIHACSRGSSGGPRYSGHDGDRFLYLALTALCHRVSLLHSHRDCDGVLIARFRRRRPSLCAGNFPVPTGPALLSVEVDHGSRNATRAETGPRAGVS